MDSFFFFSSIRQENIFAKVMESEMQKLQHHRMLVHRIHTVAHHNNLEHKNEQNNKLYIYRQLHVGVSSLHGIGKLQLQEMIKMII